MCEIIVRLLVTVPNNRRRACTCIEIKEINCVIKLDATAILRVKFISELLLIIAVSLMLQFENLVCLEM
jgi:hypothetical protein